MTEDTVPLQPEDLTEIAATDELLDGLASGRRTTPDAADTDALTALLMQWRSELDDRAATLAPFDATLAGEPASAVHSPRRWALAHRRTAATAALAVALAASTSVAAAESGTSGPLAPLHRFLFGATSQHHDATVSRVSDLLQRAADRIDAAGAAGGISAADRSSISASLDRAAALLAAHASAPGSLRDRLAGLRNALGALPSLPTPAETPTSPPTPGGNDDNGAGDHSGHDSGSQGQGTDGGGGQDGGSGGSGDSGTGGGSDGGSDGGTSSGSGSDSGSTDVNSGGGSTGGSGSDGGSSATSGSTGSGSGDSSSTSSGSGDGGTSPSGSDGADSSGGSSDLVGASGDSSGQSS